MEIKYDLLIRGGNVIDPSQKLNAVRDVAFAGGKVAQVSASIAADSAATTYDASGKLVVPGLVDSHTHMYYGVASLCVDPRTDFTPVGVTCAVDGGTAGSANFYNLRDLIIKPSLLHLYAFINIAALGLTGGQYAKPAIEMAVPERAAKIIARNRDTVIGVKVLMPGAGSPFVDSSVTLMDATVEAAKESDSKIMCHIDGGAKLSVVLDRLRPGDILTHCYQGKDPTIIGPDGRVRTEVKEARAKGVIFDIAPAGGHHFNWRVAEAAVNDGFLPDVISTDFAVPRKGDVMHTMGDCMSMMMGLGMTIEQAIAAGTCNPANAIGRSNQHGTLALGAGGDATVLEREVGSFSYEAGEHESRSLPERLVPVATISHGTMVWRQAI